AAGRSIEVAAAAGRKRTVRAGARKWVVRGGRPRAQTCCQSCACSMTSMTSMTIREIGERLDLPELDPVLEALLPDRGGLVDLTGLVAAADFVFGKRTDGVAVDREVPTGWLVGGCGFARSCLVGTSGLLANDDDVAALLAANLERLAADLLVGDRVLRRTLVTFNSHDTGPLPGCVGSSNLALGTPQVRA